MKKVKLSASQKKLIKKSLGKEALKTVSGGKTVIDILTNTIGNAFN